MRDTHRPLRQQPGFVRDLLLESPRPDDHFTLVTLVEWRDSLSVERARAAVAAHYDRDNFDPRAFMAQLGIEADIGNFTRAGR